MSVEALRKEATEMVCILLEKEKNRERDRVFGLRRRWDIVWNIP